ncbi:copper chaperone [Devosia lucknowensis]|uniref:Copper chaperone n=1 Tax=Devosia lucknowensis TaxID=1096929 RepID=A0A1Y6F7F0_9HYPH|nr:heavy-metal-associated domain-containing protein [Devosia lucknowensis]SMQ68313.1 copper chaperone [Devosia lucknowensis]
MHSFKVEDMTCGHCAATVEKAIKSVDGQADVKIDVANRAVEIRSDKTAEAFATAIGEAGYTGAVQGR